MKFIKYNNINSVTEEDKQVGNIIQIRKGIIGSYYWSFYKVTNNKELALVKGTTQDEQSKLDTLTFTLITKLINIYSKEQADAITAGLETEIGLRALSSNVFTKAETYNQVDIDRKISEMAIFGVTIEKAPSFVLVGTAEANLVYIGGAGVYSLNGVTIEYTSPINYFFWDKTNWSVLEIPISNDFLLKNDFSEAIDKELTITEYGKNVYPQVSGGDSLNDVYRWTYPDGIIKKDGKITEISFYLKVAGVISFAIGDGQDITKGFTFRKKIAEVTGTVGINKITISEDVFEGEVVAIIPSTALTQIYFGYGADPYILGSQFIQQSAVAFVAKMAGYYAFSFIVEGVTSKSKLYDTFLSKTDPKEFTGALEEEITRDKYVEILNVGVNQAGTIEDTSSSLTYIYKTNTPNNIAISDGYINTATIHISRVGTIYLTIGSIGDNAFYPRKTLGVFNAVTIGWNTFNINENIYKGEILTIGGGSVDGTSLVVFGTTGPLDNKLAQYYTDKPPLFLGAGSFYAFYYNVNSIIDKPIDKLIEQSNIRIPLENYINNQQTSNAKFVYGNVNNPNTEIVSNIQEIITVDQASLFDAIVKVIRINMAEAGVIVFSIGLIDQNNYWVEDRIISFNVIIGINTIIVNEFLKTNQQVAIKSPSPRLKKNSLTGKYYKSISEGYNKKLELQDGYISFEYDLYQYYPHVVVGRDEFNVISDNVNLLMQPKQLTIKSTPNGNIFKLVCNDDGSNLRTESIYPNNVLVIGNSITVHPLTSYWWGLWGMAATVKNKDFVNVLQSKLRVGNPNTVITPLNFAEWEQNHQTYNLNNLTPSLTGKDYIIIRLGENVSSMVNFEQDTIALIDHIKTVLPNAKVAITGMFWENAPKDVIFSSVANTKNIPFIPLSYLDVAENRSAIGNQVYGDDGLLHTIDNPGVARHPNDLGMSRIADAIFNSLYR